MTYGKEEEIFFVHGCRVIGEDLCFWRLILKTVDFEIDLFVCFTQKSIMNELQLQYNVLSHAEYEVTFQINMILHGHKLQSVVFSFEPCYVFLENKK